MPQAIPNANLGATAWRAYGLALLLGLGSVLWMFPPLALRGAVPAGAPAGADLAQQIVAQRYFLTQPWGWPLLHADALAAPLGVNIAFADGNPLAALIAKALHPSCRRCHCYSVTR